MVVSFSPFVLGDTSNEPDISASDRIAVLFQAEQVTGTIVVASLDGTTTYVHNDERAAMRFSPASTFKVLNTLIGLDAGVINSKNSTFKWDGVNRGVAAWNQDQTVQTAYRVSCVWCYQEIARSVGKEKYAADLARFEFGNRNIGDHVDQFWLDGSLQVSAIEQVEFLKKLYLNELPYNVHDINKLKEIMLDEQTPDYALYDKTGWTGTKLHTGWFVGFIEVGPDTWLFAMNMHMDEAEQAPLRKNLTLRALNALGILK
jgi:beta-lactamase class D